jgi:hypothetical protein
MGSAFGDNASLATFIPAGGGSLTAALFGIGFNGNGSGATTTVNDWAIGKFGDGAKLEARANNTYTYAGTLHGTLFGIGFTGSNSNTSVNNWWIGEGTFSRESENIFSGEMGSAFGDNASLATSISTGGGSLTAALFGIGFNGASSSSNTTTASNWAIGKFGDGATLRAQINSNGDGGSLYATLFGIGFSGSYSSNAITTASNWRIGSGNVSGRTLGDAFGDGATLESCITGGIGGEFTYVTLFGSGHANSNSSEGVADFSQWTIGNFGNGASLAASARVPKFSMASLFGPAWATGGGNESAPGNGIVDFSGWTVGNFGKNATLRSSARDYSTLFGCGWATDSGVDLSNWAVGNFGSDALLYSSAMCTTLFGSARLSQCASVDNWTIGTFNGGTTLVTMSSNPSFSGSNDYIYPSYGSVFGSAFNEGLETSPSNWSAEFNGGAVLASIGYNYDSPDNVHLGTLGGDKNNNFRFYFNGGQGNIPLVHVAALKLSDAVKIVDDRAVFTVWGPLLEPSNPDPMNYARAVALGPDFQLNIGRSRELVDYSAADAPKPANGGWETDASIASGGQATGSGGVMNIFGAIGKARYNQAASGATMRIDSGWTVNVYGPVEDLAAVGVDNGNFPSTKLNASTLNTYASLKNLTFVQGTTNVYGTSKGIGTITLNGGNLRIGRCADSGFDAAITDLQNKLAYVDSATNITYRGSEGKVVLDGDSYQWKGSPMGGRLTLNEGDTLIFHVDSRKSDPAVAGSMGNGDDDTFEFVKSYVWVDNDVEGGIVFNGGKLAIVNEDPDCAGQLPANADFWLVRSGPSQQGANVQRLFASDLTLAQATGESEGAAESSTTPMAWQVSGDDIYASEINDYAQWDAPLDIYLFDSEMSSGLYVGTGEAPRHAIPTQFAERHANAELASVTVNSTTVLKNNIEERMNNVKGNGNDPFLTLLYGNFHQDETNGFGYGSDFVGIGGGLDWMHHFSGEKYLRLGVTLGYLSGSTDFFGSASGRGKHVSHGVCSGAIFAAYETFGKNNLKTDINLFAGISHSRDKMSRVDSSGHAFRGIMKANSQFIQLEITKNMLLFRGVQIGPWCHASYNHVAQGSYKESATSGESGSQSVSKVRHNFLDTIIGVNVEKEFQDKSNPASRFRTFLKMGWCCQAMRKHSSAAVQFDIPQLQGVYPPSFGYPSRNSLALVAGFRKKFNEHVDLLCSWHASFSKNARNNILSATLGYTF